MDGIQRYINQFFEGLEIFEDISHDKSNNGLIANFISF